MFMRYTGWNLEKAAPKLRRLNPTDRLSLFDWWLFAMISILVHNGDNHGCTLFYVKDTFFSWIHMVRCEAMLCGCEPLTTTYDQD